MNKSLPSIAAAKEQAKNLRAKLASDGVTVSHGRSLELIAHQYGYRDWNTLHARIGDRSPLSLSVGDRVGGRYLSQAFSATVIGIKTVRPGWFRITLDFDEAVDVVTFSSFSNVRKRVTGVVGPAGISKEKTSDGRPHLQLDLPR